MVPLLAVSNMLPDALAPAPCSICSPFNGSSTGFRAPGMSRSADSLRRSCLCPTLHLDTPGQAGHSVGCSRPHLLIKHFPKAGGSFAKGVLSKAIAGRALTIRGEFTRVGADDWRRHFIIGLVREPCSYYVSLFAFGSSRPTAGAFARKLYTVYGKQAAAQAFGQTPPYDGPDDVRGVMFGRFLGEYGSEPFVDCWANTANLSATLRACVHEFSLQGGTVDWIAFAAAERAAHAAHPHGRALATSGENGSPHAACEAYYDNDLAHEVTHGFDAAIYSQFGFSGCCARRCARCGVKVRVTAAPTSERDQAGVASGQKWCHSGGPAHNVSHSG